MKELFVCEKPSQAEAYAEILSGNFKSKKGYLIGEDGKIFTYAFGHLVSCKMPNEINSEWGWKGDINTLPFFIEDIPLKVLEDKKEQFSVIVNLMKEAEIIYISTDAGREGEHIFHKIYKLSGLNKPLKRLWVQDMTNSGVQKAYKDAKDGEQFRGLALSGQLREESDLLIGLNATQLLTRLSGSSKVLSLGRVQTPTLAMIVNRDNLIENFKKIEHYTIAAKTLEDDITFELEIEKGKYLQKSEVLSILSDLQKRNNYLVDTKLVKEKPLKLFDLTNLQMYMNKTLGWSAHKTLDITQKLYEKKLVTYPRTSSQYIANGEELPELLNSHREHEYVRKIINENYEMEESYIDPSKVTDHEAIIITYEKALGLNQEEESLYTQILLRFLSSFYPAATYKITTATFEDNGYIFKAKEKVLVELGWRALYEEQIKSPKLPMVTLDDIGEYNIKTKETSPPKRYSESTLLEDMKSAGEFLENKDEKLLMKSVEGIGTPATRSGIIELLIERKYVNRKGNQLVSSELGREIINMMPQDFSLYSPKLTALFESMLLEVQHGKLSKKKFYVNLENLTKNISQELRKYTKQVVPVEEREAVAVCPNCRKDIYENNSGFSCSGYKEGCKTTLWKNSLEKFGKKTITQREAKKLLSGEKIKVKLKSKSGTAYDKEVKFNKQKNWVEFIK